jgi:hypothetical protein
MSEDKKQDHKIAKELIVPVPERADSELLAKSNDERNKREWDHIASVLRKKSKE